MGSLVNPKEYNYTTSPKSLSEGRSKANTSKLIAEGQHYPYIKTRQRHYKKSIDQYLS